MQPLRHFVTVSHRVSSHKPDHAGRRTWAHVVHLPCSTVATVNSRIEKVEATSRVLNPGANNNNRASAPCTERWRARGPGHNDVRASVFAVAIAPFSVVVHRQVKFGDFRGHTLSHFQSDIVNFY